MLSVLTTERFDRWFAALRDLPAKRRIQARIDRVEDRHFGDYKPVGEGVCEIRVHCGPGYRVYFTVRGTEAVILLAGGDKSSQVTDIALAIGEARKIRESSWHRRT
jgi:putative addiction module killer protein